MSDSPAPFATSPSMKLISWNVNHRVAGLAEQASRVAGERPDLVALQEVTAETGPEWERSLQGAEVEHTLTSHNYTRLERME